MIEGLAAQGHEPGPVDAARAHRLQRSVTCSTKCHFRYFYEFEKNPRYWDAASVKVEKIRCPLVESYNTTLNLYHAGELDWIGRNASLPSEFMNYLEGFDDFSGPPTARSYFFWINTKSPPLDDPKLRQRAVAGDRPRSRWSTT